MTKRRVTKEIKAELDRLQKQSKDGRLHWEAVVAAARDKSNPLNSYFDWNRDRALEAYLRQQAEELICSITRVVYTESGDKIRTRAHVSLVTDRQTGGGYRSIIDVLSDADLKAQLLADAFADLASFKERYKKLKELTEVFAAIEKVEKKRGRKPKPSGRGAPRSSGEARSLRL